MATNLFDYLNGQQGISLNGGQPGLSLNGAAPAQRAAAQPAPARPAAAPQATGAWAPFVRSAEDPQQASTFYNPALTAAQNTPGGFSWEGAGGPPAVSSKPAAAAAPQTLPGVLTNPQKIAQLIAQSAASNLAAQNKGIAGQIGGLQGQAAFDQALGAQNAADIGRFYNSAAGETHQDVGQLAGADNQILRGLPTHVLPGAGAAGAASAAASQQALRGQSQNDVQHLVDTMAGARGDQANSQMNAANQATFQTQQIAQQLAGLRGQQEQNSALAQAAARNPMQYYTQALPLALQAANGQLGLQEGQVQIAQGKQQLQYAPQDEALKQEQLYLSGLQSAGSLASATGNTAQMNALAQQIAALVNAGSQPGSGS